MTVAPFQYVSGNPDNLVGGSPAQMPDIQGPFYDLRAYLNTAIVPGLSALSPAQQVMSSTPVLDVGMLNQVRAGRQLTLADFTNMGLQAPVGLWNLTDLTDVSGNGRTLSNKGAVPFGPGINGVAGTSAVFSGSTGQALYIADTGAADPFRIKTGSWGCWFRTAKRGTAQRLLCKFASSGAGPDQTFNLDIEGTNVAAASGNASGVLTVAPGVSDVADDRWHFLVGTFDGTAMRTYVDGVLEASLSASGALTQTTAGPLNIGGYGADAGTAAGQSHYGRVDEAFVLSDVLSDDQIRLLYAAKLAHTLGSTPSTARLNVRRRRKGGTLLVTDFPAVPVRLHNFTAGSLNDEGTGGIALTPQGTAPVSVAGADGAPGGAYSFGGAGSLASTDAGLPTTTATRSFGCWLKTTNVSGGIQNIISWGGTHGSTDTRLLIVNTTATLNAANGGDSIVGPFIADGQWHHAVVVEDNAAGDGVRRKLYVDGRLVGGSTVLNSLASGGANKFHLSANVNGTEFLTGQIDGAFVTGSALTAADVAALYAKGSMALAPSPKNAGDHVEALNTADILFIGDTLDSQHTVDLAVVS